MSSPVFAQEGTEASLKDEIIQQGNQALSQMTMEFGQNAFWKMPNTEQLASQLDEPDFAPETAATTDCDQQNISGEEKKHRAPHRQLQDNRDSFTIIPIFGQPPQQTGWLAGI
ncbi:hypothetical protein [Thiolapillus sp.]|nr:hypothetical protein [Thiolapillus sp.]